MSLLSTIITYVRQYIKVESTDVVSDNTILDFLNRFYRYDIPARLQLFELKSTYEFETERGIDKYQFPYQTYQNLLPPFYVDGFQSSFYQSREAFYRVFPTILTNKNIQSGDGGVSYTFTVTSTLSDNNVLMRGFIPYDGTTLESTIPGVYVTARDGAGNTLVLQDDGTGTLSGDGSGTVDYDTGAVSVTFSAAIPTTETIRAQFYVAQLGTVRYLLFYENYLTLRPIPDKPYLIKLDAYLTPSAFLNTTQSLAFDYMDDYLARGTARRILSTMGDWEQFNAYEKLFKEQEAQVLRRTNRQQTTQRAATIYANQVDNSFFPFYPTL